MIYIESFPQHPINDIKMVLLRSELILIAWNCSTHGGSRALNNSLSLRCHKFSLHNTVPKTKSQTNKVVLVFVLDVLEVLL